MTFNRFAIITTLALAVSFASAPVPAGAQVKPVDTITRENASSRL